MMMCSMVEQAQEQTAFTNHEKEAREARGGGERAKKESGATRRMLR